MFLYCDDAAIVHVHKEQDNFAEVISPDMKLILEFTDKRGLSLNVKKTKYMIFQPPYQTRDNTESIKITDNMTIERVEKTKYLGLVLDENLSWKHHIEHLKKKLCGGSGDIYHKKPKRRSTFHYSFHTFCISSQSGDQLPTHTFETFKRSKTEHFAMSSTSTA